MKKQQRQLAAVRSALASKTLHDAASVRITGGHQFPGLRDGYPDSPTGG